MGQIERQTPVVYEAEDGNGEIEDLKRQLSNRMAAGDRSIAVLFFQNRHVWGYANGLKEAGFDVEVWDKKEKSGLTFGNGVPKVMTWNSAKGLTFDSVLIPRLVPGAFGPVSSARREKLLCVAITRATRWAYLSTCRDKVLPELDRLRQLSATPSAPIVWQRPVARSSTAQARLPMTEDLL